MKYDFETLISKKGQGSYKWEIMYNKNPNVDDNIVPLSVADMELKIAPEITDGLKKYLDEAVIGYTGGYENYYDSVISWMKKRHNYIIEKDWIVTTNGVVNALNNLVKTFSKEGDGIIVMTPVYYPFYKVINNNNRKIVENKLINNDGYYTVNFEELEQLASDKNNNLMILCSPHNPIGRVWNTEELKKIADIMIKHNVTIISDEIHFDLIMPDNKHTVLSTISKEIEDKVVVCTAPTKTFNLAGIGISNIIIKNEEMRKKFKEQQEKSSDNVFFALGYKACELAYNYSEKWVDELLILIEKNSRYVQEFVNEYFNGIIASPLQGTYLQWIDFNVLGLIPAELEKFMNEKANLYMSEGYTFGNGGKGFERMNLAVNHEVIKKAMDRLYNAIKTEFPNIIKK